MFSDIPQAVRDQMVRLEGMAAHDSNAQFDDRLRQIPKETGQFIALLAASAPPGRRIEVGTSGGYSGLWLSLACRDSRCLLTTFEILAKKVELARRTFADAELDDLVKVIEADGRRAICHLDDIGFCFLDTTSDAYDDIYAAVVPKLVPGGILVADNAISHRHEISHVVEKAFSDKRVDALIVPIGKGVLVCRRIGDS